MGYEVYVCTEWALRAADGLGACMAGDIPILWGILWNLVESDSLGGGGRE